MKKADKVAIGILAGGIAYFIGTATVYMPFVISDAKKNYKDSCEYLMILGGDIIGADTPSPQLLERMKGASAYLNEYKDVIAVPCGGCFRPNQKKSEAQIIADYLVSHGVEESRIILEEKSTTTFENFEFALEIIENHSGIDRKELNVAFLSSSYHIHRAGLIAEKCGLENYGRVSVPTPGDAFQRYIREYFVAYEFPKRAFLKMIGRK